MGTGAKNEGTRVRIEGQGGMGEWRGAEALKRVL